MRTTLIAFAILLATVLAGAPAAPAAAQTRGGDLSGSIERLQNNPRYEGRIIGTQIRRTARGPLYEVQILRPDDRVIVVYIDPATGGVVGDSERRGGGNDRGERDRGRGRGRGRN